MAKVKVSVTMSAALLAQVRRLTPNVSDFVERAVADYANRQMRREALETSRGGWTDSEHPDLKTAEDMAAYVRSLRARWRPPHE